MPIELYTIAEKRYFTFVYNIGVKGIGPSFRFTNQVTQNTTSTVKVCCRAFIPFSRPSAFQTIKVVVVL